MTVMSTTLGAGGFLPPKVVEVSKDTIRNFQHSKKVGNYLLGNTIGEGSFAKVKEALHIPTGEKVAIKVIDKKKVKADSYVRKNLRREGKILQMIRHSNVVQLYEIMETENSYYLVTELCKGGDLMDFICMKKRLEERETKKFIRQIISALDYLHRLGILHRDLKVENLLLDENRDIKIIDFGLSNCIKVTATKDGVRAQEHLITQCGSPAYAAPELLGRKKYGPQVDVWSIGINMYAMLTGNLPFTVEPFNIKTLHNKMVTGQMNPMPDNISKDCRDLLKKFLNPDPEKRISLPEAMKHPWVAESRSSPMEPSPCPNKLKTDELDENIMKHMVDSQGFRMSEIIRFVTGNVPSPATAMYHIVNRKLTKYMADMRVQGKISALDSSLLGQSKVGYIFQHPRLGGPHNHTPSQRHYTSHHVPFVAKTIGQVKPSNQNKNNTNKNTLNKKVATNPPDKMCKDPQIQELQEFQKENPDTPTLEFTNLVFNEPENSETPIQDAKLKATDVRKQHRQYIPEVAQKYAVGQTHETELEKDSGFDSEMGESPRKVIRNNTNKMFVTLRRQPHIKSKLHSVEPQLVTEKQNILQLNLNKGNNEEKDNESKITTPQIKIHRFNTNKKEENSDKKLNGFIRKTEIRMTDGGKILGLAYLPRDRIRHRRFSQNGARFSFDRNKVICRPQMKHFSSLKVDGEVENRTKSPLETVSPISSLSKQISSRATTHSMKSVSTKDSHVALPCISPGNTFRNQ